MILFRFFCTRRDWNQCVLGGCAVLAFSVVSRSCVRLSSSCFYSSWFFCILGIFEPRVLRSFRQDPPRQGHLRTREVNKQEHSFNACRTPLSDVSTIHQRFRSNSHLGFSCFFLSFPENPLEFPNSDVVFRAHRGPGNQYTYIDTFNS